MVSETILLLYYSSTFNSISVIGAFDLQRAKMNIGDFFVTKHSNLSQTHVVFHLAAFDSSTEEGASSLKKSDLSSRHPAILGLRNILKTCISHNIQTLTFPLLLAHSMTEVSGFKHYFMSKF